MPYFMINTNHLSNAILFEPNLNLIVNYNTAITLKALITHRPSFINHIDNNGKTLLYFAYHAQRDDMVTVLLKAKAADIPINVKRDYAHTIKGGIDTLHYPNQYIIHSTIQKAQFNFLKLLIQNDINLLEQRNYNGKTPLLLAIECHFLPGISYLISMGANTNAAISSFFGSLTEKTALHLAYIPGDYRIIKKLILAGAIDTACDGQFIFHKLINDGQLELIQLLLEKQPLLLNQIDKNGKTPIMLANEAKWDDIVDYLQTQGAELIGKKTPYYPSIDTIDIHTAAKLSFHKQIKMLLYKDKSRLNQQNKARFTPLMSAVIYGQFTRVEYLIAQKNINLNLKTLLNQKTELDCAYSALDLACALKHDLIALSLMEAGAEPADLSTTTGQEQLFLAATFGCINIVERLLARCFDNALLADDTKMTIFRTSIKQLLTTERYSAQPLDILITIATRNNYKFLLAFLNNTHPNEVLSLPSTSAITDIRRCEQAAAVTTERTRPDSRFVYGTSLEMTFFTTVDTIKEKRTDQIDENILMPKQALINRKSQFSIGILR